jgi:hypothetical protein
MLLAGSRGYPNVFSPIPGIFLRRPAYQERKKAEMKAKWAEKKKAQAPAEAPKPELIHFTITGEELQTNVEDVKRCFSAYGTVKWVYYNKGDKEGHVQMGSDATAVRRSLSTDNMAAAPFETQT